MTRARALRSFDGRGMGLRIFGHMIGHLLLRSVARAQRIHLAMRCRGFDGEVRTLRELRFRVSDAAFTLGCCTAFAALRLYNVPAILGRLATELVG
jgi:cobalt/nickel transport system permease protein